MNYLHIPDKSMTNVGVLHENIYWTSTKGALTWYRKLTRESDHAWNFIIVCLLIVWGMGFIFMMHLSYYAISLLIYDVMYDIITIP